MTNKKEYIYNIDNVVSEFDFDLILHEAANAQYKNIFFEGSYNKLVGETHDTDPEWFDKSNWQVSLVTDGEALRLSEKIANIINIDVDYLKPQFLKLYKGEELRWHVDKLVRVGINFVLQGAETPVQFLDYPEPIYYNSAILNTSEMHCVPFTKDEDRILLKMRIPPLTENTPISYNFKEIVEMFEKNT